MKPKIFILKVSIVLPFLLAGLLTAQTSTVPDNFFGVNAWMNQFIGNNTNNYDCYGYNLSPVDNCEPNGKFDQTIITNCPQKVSGTKCKTNPVRRDKS